MKPLVAAMFRQGALGAGAVAVGLAITGLIVVRSDAERLWHGLTSGAGLAAVVISAASGVGTLWLVCARRYEPARATAAVAVAAVIAGWALAQRPELLPGLTIHQAAAGRPTLISLLIGIGAGIVVLLPSLGLLYGLVLHGTLDDPTRDTSRPPALAATPPEERLLATLTILKLATAVPLTVLAAASWARGIGIALGVRLIADPRSEPG